MAEWMRPARVYNHRCGVRVNSKILLAFTLALLFLVLLPSVGWAHRMDMGETGEGVLQVTYDGGLPARRAQVVLYDIHGVILGQGAVDENGLYHFDPELPVFRAQAEDGLGHLAELVLGEEAWRLPRSLGALVGVFFFLALAGGFKMINQKRGES